MVLGVKAGEGSAHTSESPDESEEIGRKRDRDPEEWGKVQMERTVDWSILKLTLLTPHLFRNTPGCSPEHPAGGRAWSPSCGH